MIVVLDTCILKLATFSVVDNASALIVELGLQGLVEIWASPSMLDEYADVLAEEPDFLADVSGRLQVCFPLITLDVIRHEPDNRFLECALAIGADYLITVNTAKGHFDRRRYDAVQIVTPGAFVGLAAIQPMIRRLS